MASIEGEIRVSHIDVREASGYKCFLTLDVALCGKVVGMIQCVGPCYGPFVSGNHTHGPWLSYVGPDGKTARNLAGTFPDRSSAVDAVIAELGLSD